MSKSLLVAAVLVVFATTAYAGPGQTGFWIAGNVGYILAKEAETKETIDGAGFLLDLEGMLNPNVSLGLSIGYGVVEGQLAGGGVVEKIHVSAVPTYLYLKYWFGATDSDIRGYLGAGLGTYISYLDVTNQETGNTASFGQGGGGVTVPVGIMYALSESWALNVTYRLNWLIDSDYVENGLTHFVGVGLAFSMDS